MAAFQSALLTFVFCALSVKAQLREIDILGQACNKNESGSIVYQTCMSDSQFLSTIPFNLDVSPPENTCGTEGRVDDICYLDLGITPCLKCDENDDELKHPPEYMVDNEGTTDLGTFWQSRSWLDYKTTPTAIQTIITLSWNKTYELSNVIVDFRSFRPHQMILEKSVDNGATWEPLQYYMFGRDCAKYIADGLATDKITKEKPEAVICTDKFSGGAGEVKFDVETDRYHLFLGTDTNYEQLMEAFDDTNLLPFLRFTDLRIRLLKPATDGNLALGKPQDLIKYNYGIYNIDVVGWCFCNLHAQFCVEKTLGNGDEVMECDCKHNTAGVNCEMCLPLYNNRLWQAGSYLPFPTGSANECQKCECNDHADSCTYNADVSKGVCDNCQHNTKGTHCDSCAPGFARNNSVEVNDVNVCYDCACEVLGSDDQTTCNAVTGKCICVARVTGRACDVCEDEYYGLLLQDNEPGTCKDCACNLDGTVAQSKVCEPHAGQCPCKPNIGGRDCSECKEGYYNYPTSNPSRDCIACGCSKGGSESQMCDQSTGACTCLPNTVGGRCNSMEAGFYAPAIDALRTQPRLQDSNTCALSQALLTPQYPFSGRVFSLCDEGEMTGFESLNSDVTPVQPESTWNYHPVLRYSLAGSGAWSSVTLRYTVDGSTADKVCSETTGANFDFVATDLPPGNGLSWMSDVALALSTSCIYRPSVTATTAGNGSQPLTVDSLVLVPELETINAYSYSDEAGKAAVRTCYKRILDLATTEDALSTLQTECREIAYSVGAQMAQGGLACECNEVGSVQVATCSVHGGQCTCKPGVFGRQCDLCMPGYYNFTSEGCTACECSELGSSNLVCDYESGQCPCQPFVATAAQANVLGIENDLRCRSCLVDYFGFSTGERCSPCDCNTAGRNNSQCTDDGQCECKPTITGLKCDMCEPGYYDFKAEGCSECGCDPAGSEGGECQATSGTCTCKSNVIGDKCMQCNDDSFNLAADNPEGCQKCFCFGHSTVCTSAEGFLEVDITSESTRDWGFSDPTQPGTYSHMSSSAEFTGNRLSSYNQILSMDVTTVGSDPIPYAGHQVIVLEGNGRHAYYTPADFTATSTKSRLELRLHHTLFHFNETLQPNAFQFNAILADLTALHIQTVFNNKRVTITDVTLETTSEGDTEAEGVVVAKGVEQCTCDSARNTAGRSCEICAQGFKRPTPDEPNPVIVPCTACDCNKNGKTDLPECDETSGVCLNCRDGTVGEQCESCAPNVIEPACELCQDEYFGISQEGCSPCNCDEVGSENGQMCDKDTGSCTCRDNVVGDKCDVCEDNYYELTEAGCKECNDCYGLVMIEVQDLREMRDNMTAFVGQLEEGDQTQELGPFEDRLEATQASMTDLTNFLTEANVVQGKVDADITKLNTTLQDSRFRLDVTAAEMTIQANESVHNSETLVTQSQTLVEHVTTQGTSAHGMLTGEVSELTSSLEALSGSLAAIEEDLSETSGAASGDVEAIAAQVEEIEEMSTQTLETATSSRQLATTSATTHEQTTSAVTSLLELLGVVQNQQTQISSASDTARADATQLRTDANAQKAEIEGVASINTDYEAMQAQAEQLQTDASTLKDEVQAATVGEGSTVGRVDDAEERTASLVTQTASLDTAVKADNDRVVAANTEAMAALDREMLTFTKAGTMADTMENFDQKATDVEAAANEALADVERITEISQEAIDSSTALRTQLQPIRTKAQAAWNTAKAGLALAQEDNEQIAALQPDATALAAKTGSSLNNIEEESRQVLVLDSAPMQRLQAAFSRGDENKGSVDSLSAKVDTAEENATDVKAKVSSRQSRLQSIETALNNLEGLDPELINDLRAMVDGAKETMAGNRDLSGIIQQLKAKSEEQKLDIASFKTRRDLIRSQITRYKEIVNQLSFR